MLALQKDGPANLLHQLLLVGVVGHWAGQCQLTSARLQKQMKPHQQVPRASLQKMLRSRVQAGVQMGSQVVVQKLAAAAAAAGVLCQKEVLLEVAVAGVQLRKCQQQLLVLLPDSIRLQLQRRHGARNQQQQW